MVFAGRMSLIRGTSKRLQFLQLRAFCAARTISSVEQDLVDTLGAAASSIEGVFCCGGSFALPSSGISLWFNNQEARQPFHLNLPPRSPSDNAAMQQLMSCCEPATFGRGKEDVYDESYRKALALSPELFGTNLDIGKTSILDDVFATLASCTAVRVGFTHALFNELSSRLDPGTERPKTPKLTTTGTYGAIGIMSDVVEGSSLTHLIQGVRADLYKLNVYSQGGFFKPHADTPREGSMFGSLVICLPHPHTGGNLVVRHKGLEQVFDWSDSSKVHWAAFYSDCEHEILPVESGSRVTLTFNLSRSNRGGTGVEWPALPEHFPKQCACCDPLESKSKEDLWWKSLARARAGPDYFPGETNSQLDVATLPLYTQLKAAMDNADFFPGGCVLGFGCQHHYVETTVDFEKKSSNFELLKGADAILYAAALQAGLLPSLVRVFKNGPADEFQPKSVMARRDVIIGELDKGLADGAPNDIGFRSMLLDHEIEEYDEEWNEERTTTEEVQRKKIPVQFRESEMSGGDGIVWCTNEQEWLLRGTRGHLGNAASWDHVWYSAAAILLHVPPLSERRHAQEAGRERKEKHRN